MNLGGCASACVAAGLAAVCAFLATPVAIQTARRFSFYDRPQTAGYKVHGSATPYLGGTAVITAFIVAILAVAGNRAHSLAFVCAAMVMLVVGTIDDRRSVSPGTRVLIEFALGALLAIDGLGWKLGGGEILDAAATGAWVVFVVNAFNLFDNMDGQASTMAIVSTAGIGALAIINGAPWVAVGSAAVCGACLGFLPHNLRSPARIFLGDGGSMPVGFAVAILAARAAQTAETSTLSLLVGFLLVGIPALDTTLVCISRRRRGIPLLTGGRDHLTHRTRQKVKTPRRVALVLGGTQAVISAVVIITSRFSSSAVIYIALSFFVCAAMSIIALEDALDGTASILNRRLPVDSAAAGSRQVSAVDNKGVFARHGADLGLVCAGLYAGLSPLFSAYYDQGVWTTIGIVTVVITATALVARPPRCTRAAILALAAVAAIGLWSLLSSVWADQTFLAATDGNLWLTYFGFLLVVVVLLAAGGRARVLLGSLGLGVTVVVVSVIVRLLGPDAGLLLPAGRLNSPLGYINGMGCVAVMGGWLAIALAERRQPVLAALGAGLAVCMFALALLSQSRGAAVACVVSIFLMLLVVPGFRRRVVLLACLAAGVGVAARSLLSVYTTGADAASGLPAASTIHHAIALTLIGACASGLVWGVLTTAAELADQGDGLTGRTLRAAATALATVIVLVPCAFLAVRFSWVKYHITNQWHEFTHLAPAATTGAARSRLFSGAGNRYDYWRVAWLTFKSHPVIGVGAGNYVEPYYRYRRTTETIQNPHSIELQILSELGVVGGLLLAALLVAIVLGFRRVRRPARSSSQTRTLLVGAGGVTIGFFVDTSGDWMHLLPGVMAMALCCIAVLCQSPVETANADRSDTSRRAAQREGPRGQLITLAGAGLAVLALAIGGASLLQQGASSLYLDHGDSALVHDPNKAISNAREALRIDPGNLSAYYTEAAGQARFDRAQAARTTLLRAVGQAPEDYLTWFLLGDLETRAGHLGQARSDYARALSLDPREPGLAELARDPTAEVDLQ